MELSEPQIVETSEHWYYVMSDILAASQQTDARYSLNGSIESDVEVRISQACVKEMNIEVYTYMFMLYVK